MDISSLTTSASVVAAWIALILSLINVRTSRRALRLSEQQEERRKPSLVAFLKEGFTSSNSDSRVYAFLLSVSNRSDNNNSVADATLHLTYSKAGASQVTVKFGAERKVPSSYKRGQEGLSIPVRIDAHQVISGWYFFSVDHAILRSATIERTQIILRDTYGNEVAIEPMILREYSDDWVQEKENLRKSL